MSNVKKFGALGDGKTDDTSAIQHALNAGDGVLEFPRGNYRITKTLIVDLAKTGRTGIHGSGGTAKLIMTGPGPAILLKGTHAKTADPAGFRPAEWQMERMPTVSNIEIEGRHRKADGILDSPLRWKVVIERLQEKGYSESDLKKIMGLNFLRVYRQVFK